MNVKDVVCNSVYNDLVDVVDNTGLHRQRGKSFLVSGGNGFIAYYLVLCVLLANDLFELNNTIYILVRDKEKTVKKYQDLLKRRDLIMVIGDVSDNNTEFGGPYDFIVHAASGASAEQFNNDPFGVFNANVMGTENLINNIIQLGCESMVFISSFTVYGDDTKSVPVIDEKYRGKDDWETSSACYVYGKKSAEFLCSTSVRKYGCPVKIVRPGFVYGDSSPMDNRVYAEIIRNLAEKKNIVMKSSGMLFRSMVYVTDVVRGIIFALLQGQDGEAYNIANEFVSIRQFAELASMADETGTVKVEFVNPDDYKVDTSTVNGGQMETSKLETCGWKAKVSISEGIKMAAESYVHKYLQ